MGSVVGVWIIVIGVVWYIIHAVIESRPQVDRHYWFEHDNKVDEFGNIIREPKPQPEKKERSSLYKFWDKHYVGILLGIYLAAMVIGQNTGSLAIMIICLIILVIGLIIILSACFADIGNKMIKRSVQHSSVTKEDLEKINKKYGLSDSDHIKALQLWQRDEYNRRKIL